LLSYRINGQFIIKPGYTHNNLKRNIETEFKLNNAILIGIFDIDHEYSEQQLHDFLKKNICIRIPIIKHRSQNYNKYLLENDNPYFSDKTKEYMESIIRTEDLNKNSKKNEKLKSKITSTECYYYNFNIYTTTLKYCFMSTLNARENYEIAKLKVEDAKIKLEGEINKGKELDKEIQQMLEETKRHKEDEETKRHKEDEETKRRKEEERTKQLKEIKEILILGKELNNQEIINNAIELLKKVYIE
jgi:hypothetical protein